MPVQRGGLQVREEEQSRFLPVFWNHTSSRFTASQHVDLCPGQTCLQSRSRCPQGEERWKGMLLLPCHPLRATVPNFSFHTFCKYSFELFGSVVFIIIIIFSTLRKWLQKKILIRIDYFILLFHTSFFLFPLNQKEIRYRTTCPLQPTPSPFMQNWKWQYLMIAITVEIVFAFGCVLFVFFFFLNYEYV